MHENSALEFGFSVSEVAADVQAMKDSGRGDGRAPAWSSTAAFKISQALKQAGVEDVVFYAPEGYKQSTLEKYGDAAQQLDLPARVRAVAGQEPAQGHASSSSRR